MDKDLIIRNNGVMNTEVSKDLTEHCNICHIRYQCYLNEQRKVHEEEKSREKLREEEESENEMI